MMEHSRSFKVPNMCCPTCAALVRQSMSNVSGVKAVQITVQARRVTVEWHDPTTWRDIERQLDLNGYPPGPPLAHLA